MIIHHIRPYGKGSVQDWILTIGKFFGTGVLLATAFVHLFPEAMSNFASPCLDEGWKVYGSFAGVFCMISSFALQLLELAAVSNVDRLINKQKGQTNRNSNDCERQQFSKVNNINECTTIQRMDSLDSATGTSSEKNQEQLENHHHSGHVHSAGLLETENAFKDINTIILELGIVMHSIIIGITLANTQSSQFVTLLIALVFHQFFEGIALGTRVNELVHVGWMRPLIMGLLYIIMTPIGISIGIGIHSSFNPNSPSSVLASAILDSLSAGILLYNAYVSLMSTEINQNDDFRRSSWQRKLVSFISMYVGAGLMALIGLWA
ncbi:Zinc/iron permease [Halteromyces radiatus]|uniref:Zinc/iron permease n=1 Tax=Halteromyces radiatus TaxID=101107 RepID=UPI002221151A|nr:Zinc/iron permease [Halteromyces radiatus]KAI8083042.1 Zinc/iron permease [Halteromyces radiatus]